MDYLAVAIDALAKALANEAPAQAAPAAFRPFAVEAAGMARYLADAELPTWLADPPAWPEGDDAAEAFDGSPTEPWEAAEEPSDGCPRCGSLASWWSIIDTRRCLACEPPRHDAEGIRAKAARIRKRTMKTQH